MSALTRSIRKYFTKTLRIYSGLPRRLQVLTVCLVAAVLFSAEFNMLYKPQRSYLMKLKWEEAALQDKILMMRAHIPDVRTEEQLLDKSRVAYEYLLSELGKLEQKLPQQDSLPVLLAQLLKESEGFAIDFTLIRPEQNKEKREYDSVDMEMRFNASYPNLVKYLKRIEEKAGFINIKEIDIKDNLEENSSLLDVKVLMSTLLAQNILPQGTGVQRAALGVPASLGFDRDPFGDHSGAAFGSVQPGAFILSGVISQGGKATAIINDEVYKAGDWIGKSQVIEISKDQVVLRSGEEKIVLLMDKE